MTVRMQPVDAVIVGLGWTGSIAAKELADAGLSVVALERGPAYDQADDFAIKRQHDYVGQSMRGGPTRPLDRNTLSFRNRADQTALPMRQTGSFNPAWGFGGSGNTWAGHCYRATDRDFNVRSVFTERYGAAIWDEDLTSRDWGVTYADLAPHYETAERMMGVSGTAGNLRGEIRPGGNPFEEARETDIPLPAFERDAMSLKFIETATGMGLHPFAIPTGNASADYTNPYGARMNACVVCGHCPGLPCAYGAKSTPTIFIHPTLMGMPNFEARAQAEAIRVERGPDGLASGVTYVDAAGRETFQPAGLVILAAYAFDNTRLMLLSGIGAPYDPANGTGVVGRNYSYQVLASVQALFEDEVFNPFVAAGATGTNTDDYGTGNFDPTTGEVAPFVGGGLLGAVHLSAPPVQWQPMPDGSPPWGDGWKEAVAKWYGRTLNLNVHASCQSARQNHLDLDPTYRDAYGLPLLRMTFDSSANDYRMHDFLMARAGEMARAMDPAHVKANRLGPVYDITRYQTTHNMGGTALGADLATSVVNTSQQSWDVHNLFVLGGSVFPQNFQYNPTLTINALAYHALGRIIGDYLDNPRALG